MALADGVVYDPRISPTRTAYWDEVTQHTDDSAVTPPVAYALYLQFEQLTPELIGTYSELTTTFSIADRTDGQYYLHMIAINGNNTQSDPSNTVPFEVARTYAPKPTILRME